MSRLRHRTFLFISVAVTVTVLAAGCSGKKSQGADTGLSGGGGASSADVRGVTDTEVVIGGLGALTSPQGGYPGVDTGAKARYERANREGGVAGRQIKFVGFQDDGEVATQNLDLARKLVQQDKVFAIAPGVGQGWLPPTTDFLQQNKVPFVGWGYMPGFCGNSFGFGFNGCTSPSNPTVANGALTGGIIDLKNLGPGNTVAIQSYDNEAGRVPLIQMEAAFEAAGLEVVYSDSKMPVTDAADFTPFVQKIMTSANGKAPDLVAMITTFANTIGLTGSLTAAGYDGTTINYVTYAPGLLASQPQVAASLAGTFVNTSMLPEEFGGTAIAQMQDDLTAIGADPQISIGTSVGYWSADVLVQMLEKVGKDLTVENFEKIINGGFTYEPQGDPIGIGPVEFPRDHEQATPCASIVEVKGTEYVPAVPMTCYDMIPLG